VDSPASPTPTLSPIPSLTVAISVDVSPIQTEETPSPPQLVSHIEIDVPAVVLFPSVSPPQTPFKIEDMDTSEQTPPPSSLPMTPESPADNPLLKPMISPRQPSLSKEPVDEAAVDKEPQPSTSKKANNFSKNSTKKEKKDESVIKEQIFSHVMTTFRLYLLS